MASTPPADTSTMFSQFAFRFTECDHHQILELKDLPGVHRLEEPRACFIELTGPCMACSTTVQDRTDVFRDVVFMMLSAPTCLGKEFRVHQGNPSVLELMAGEIIRSNWYEVEDGSHRGTDGPAPGLTGGKVYCMDSVDLDSRNLYRIHRMTGIKYRVDRPAGGGLASGDEAGSGNTSGDEAESEAAEEDEADADLASDAEGDKLKVVKAESTTEASE